MTKKKIAATRIRHSDEYKTNTLELTEAIGFTQAAKDLGLHSSQLYQWRSAAAKNSSASEREKDLATQVVKLKRQLAKQDEELQILKKAAVGSINERMAKTLVCDALTMAL